MKKVNGVSTRSNRSALEVVKENKVQNSLGRKRSAWKNTRTRPPSKPATSGAARIASMRSNTSILPELWQPSVPAQGAEREDTLPDMGVPGAQKAAFLRDRSFSDPIVILQ